MLSFVSLHACRTSISDLEEYIGIINTKDVVIYSYKEKCESLKALENYFTFEEIDSINLNHEYIVINIDCSKYLAEMTKGVIAKIEVLLYSEKHFMVNFIDAPHYRFLDISDTFLSGSSSHLRGVEFLRSYYNFAHAPYVYSENYGISSIDPSKPLENIMPIAICSIVKRKILEYESYQ